MKIAFVVDQFPAVSETFVLNQITGLLDRGQWVDIFARNISQDCVVHEEIRRYNLTKRTYHLNSYMTTQNKLSRFGQRLTLLFRNFHKNPRAVLSSLDLAKWGKRALSLEVFSQIKPFLDKEPYDVLHCQFGPNGFLGLMLTDVGLFQGKVITSFLGHDISAYPKAMGSNIYQDLFARGDLFLCVSKRVADKLTALGCDTRKVVVHRLGIDTKKFHPALLNEKQNRPPRILTVARLVEKKGVEYGIKSVAKLTKNFPNLEYTIVGDGPLRPKLQQLIDALDLAAKIRLIGSKTQGEIAGLLETSDILLAPSVTAENGDEEGIPVVITEALAHGIPVVSTSHAGIPEVIHDGVSGFLLPERDIDGLAEKLGYLLSKPEIRLDMGLRGRRFIDEYYDIEKLNDRLIELYRRPAVNGSAPIVPMLSVSA
jgi:colanic acid/amylovoran biosynthesis glycosyltransferase